MNNIKMLGNHFRLGQVKKGEIPTKNKGIISFAIFRDKEGQIYTWSPTYEDLSNLICSLIALHGEEEVITEVLGSQHITGEYFNNSLKRNKRNIEHILTTGKDYWKPVEIKIAN